MKAALALLACAAAGGCAVGPDFERPAAPTSLRYLPPDEERAALDPQQQRVDSAAPVPAQWWTLFGSNPLDEAVQSALAHNGTLQAAESVLRESEETLEAGRGAFYPAVSADVSAQRIRPAPIQQGSAARGEPFSVLSASGAVTFPLDIFGGRRRAVEGLAAQVDLQRYEAAAARVTLAANVVDAAIAQASYRAERQSTLELIALEREQMRSVDAQVRAGTAALSSSLTLQSLVAGDEAALAALEQRLSMASHQLAVLEGIPPSEFAVSGPDFGELRLPRELPLTLPSALVRQRPDILAAEARLHAASANIGVATAAMFPSFDIAGDYGAAGAGPASWFDSIGRFWSVGPALALPLFQGGSLLHARRAAVDEFQSQQAIYRQTVLSGLGEVADALTALRHDAQAVRAQQAASDAAREALRLLQANEGAGLVAFADVLAADVAFHQATIGLVQAKAAQYQDTVALLAALGGGWWDAPAQGARP